jgi:hypothetical protein
MIGQKRTLIQSLAIDSKLEESNQDNQRANKRVSKNHQKMGDHDHHLPHFAGGQVSKMHYQRMEQLNNLGAHNFQLNSMSMNVNPNSQLSGHGNPNDEDKKGEDIHTDDLHIMDNNSFIQVSNEREQRKHKEALYRLMKENQAGWLSGTNLSVVDNKQN